MSYHSFPWLAGYLPFFITNLTYQCSPTCASSARNFSALISRRWDRWARWNMERFLDNNGKVSLFCCYPSISQYFVVLICPRKKKKNLVQHRMRTRKFNFDVHMLNICVHHLILLPVYFGFTRLSVVTLVFNLLQQAVLSCGTVNYAVRGGSNFLSLWMKP